MTAMTKKLAETDTTAKFKEALVEIRQKFSKPQPRKRKPRTRTYKYEPSLISYLDILGMKDLLEHAGEDANLVSEVLEHFRRFSAHEEYQKELWHSKFVNFSDLALRILPILTDANLKHRLGCFFHEVMDLGLIQANLVNRAILIRGAMTIGFICHDGGLTFGPGLAEAYRLEQHAVYPRIIISEEAMLLLQEAPVLRAEGNSYKEEMSYLKEFLRKDTDGFWFLDYLALVRTESDGPRQYARFLQSHKKLIEKQRLEVTLLPKGKERKSRIVKLKWLIELHRRHIGQNNPEIFLEQTGMRLNSLRVRVW
jgi:hypothetical protein